MQTAATTTIDRDREFDQTAKTEPAAACPVCRSAECHRVAPPPAVSPSIIEFRNLELKNENLDLTEKLRVANERIAGFERMLASFAAKIDNIQDSFDTLTLPKRGGYRKYGA